MICTGYPHSTALGKVGGSGVKGGNGTSRGKQKYVPDSIEV